MITIPLGHLHDLRGVAAILDVILVGDAEVALHMTLQPCPGRFLDGWFGDPRTWRLFDDVGTPYQLTEGPSSRGNYLACQTSFRWKPSPPSTASTLTIAAALEGQDIMCERVNLVPYR